MKKIYILLTRSDTWISKLINLATDDTYTHASISFESGLQPLYSFSRECIHLPLPAGLRHEPLDYGFFKKYDTIPCALYELEVSDEVYDTAKEEVEQMMTKQGSTFGIANNDSMWKFLAGGNFTVTAAAKAQAQADIADDGYWGVNQTSDRILDFAKALTGGDPDQIEKMREAFEKGFNGINILVLVKL